MGNERLEDLLYEAGRSIGRGDTKNGLRLCKQAYILDSENIEVLGMMGDIYLMNEDIENAEECYSDAKKLHPENVHIRNSLANLYFEQRDYGRSSEEIAETLEMSPDDIGSRYLLGAIRLNLGDDDVAREDFEKVIKQKANMPLGTIGRETQEISILNSYLGLYEILKRDEKLGSCAKMVGRAWAFRAKCELSKMLFRLSGGLIST